MATTSKTTKKSTTKTTAPKEPTNVEEVVEPVVEPVKEVDKPAKKRVTSDKIDLNDLVEVRSRFYGGLTYISRKTGYRVSWSEYDSFQYLTIDELMTMRNTQPQFFTNNWVVIVGDNAEDVKSFLQIDRYYKGFDAVDGFDELFGYEPDEIIEVVGKMSGSMKENVARRAYALIKSGELDSVKVIAALEEACGYELRE